MNVLDSIWLIPIFPLLGAALMLFAGRYLDPQPMSDVAIDPALAEELKDDPEYKHLVSPATAHHGHDDHGHDDHGHYHVPPTRKFVGYLCAGAVLLSFLVSLTAVIQLAGTESRSHEVVLYDWLSALPMALTNGQTVTLSAQLGFLLDPLSAVMLLVVSGIGFLIHVYSTGYMAHDNGYYRFFGYLNLFVFFMLTLVLANNYLLLFVGWEGVGLCSYLLIGFYFHKKSAGNAGNKAFLVNRIGDAGFLLATMLVFVTFGTVRFTEITSAVLHHPEAYATAAWGSIGVICLLYFFASTGKSAQFPLFVWLPDAMEGPTPVSALIHAATMVTAGVYLLARSNVLFQLAPEVSPIVASIGALTAIMAASIALVLTDIKRVLAYSTVSQLGFMFLAAGVGAYWVAVFHVVTHAFFKALLFLGSGSVIHAMGGQQDMRHMGGLKDKIPVTFRTMFIGSLAIAGIPGLAGFFSKDEILWQTVSSPLGSNVLYVVGLGTAGLTAFYMWRMMFLTFYGKPRMDEHTAAHVHESPAVMTLPLSILAAGSILVGWLGVPAAWSALPSFFHSFEHWLHPITGIVVQTVEHAAEGHAESHDHVVLEWGLMLLSVTIAVIGIAIARWFYIQNPGKSQNVQQAAPGLHRFLDNKWYLDAFYNHFIVRRLVLGGGHLLTRLDAKVVDGGVNGAAWLTRRISQISMWWDSRVVDGAVGLSAFLVRAASIPIRFAQSGSMQVYALVIVLGLVVIIGVYGRF